jgi:hypothetical protein
MNAKIILAAMLAVCAWLPVRVSAEGSWLPLAHPAPGGVETMLLLSDGTVLAQGGGGASWYQLIPNNGGYTNGNWSTNTAAMHYSRLYYSSDVLPNGEVFVAGAEYGTGTTNAEIYDPVANIWNIIPVPNGIINKNNFIGGQGQNTAGFIDSGSSLLNNGQVLVMPVANFSSGETTTYDPVANVWSTATLKNRGNEDEACSVRLPDDSILVVDSGGTSSERYIPSLNAWINDATVPVPLYDSYGTEQGPGFLLPNGNAFFIGSAPYTAIYTPSGGTSPGSWIAGPNIPNSFGAPDAPACMMNNGKILCALSQTPFSLNGTNDIFTIPSYFYEYDYSSGPIGAFTQIHAPGGGYTRGEWTFNDRMLQLPDGTVLFTDGGSQLYCYVPDGSPLPAGRPNIYSVKWNAGGSLHITGTLFSGISCGAAYGDDAQMDSNYPLVRFTSGGTVYYGRTYNWSSTTLQSGQLVSTEVQVPAGVLTSGGAWTLQVVCNGNASGGVTFNSPGVWVDFVNYNAIFQFGTFAFPYATLPQGVSAVSSGGTIAIDAGSQPSVGTVGVPYTISTPMTIISVYGPSTIK